jgi:uncharacterized protein
VLSALRFQTGTAAASVADHRADVACFIGYVARRPRAALPGALRRQLQQSGWARGVWLPARKAYAEARLEGLINVPVVVESWDDFDRLFAWDRRPVLAGQAVDDQSAYCATYLGAAVRAFFAHGGRRAYIVRVGDPWAYSGDRRIEQRVRRWHKLLPSSRFDALSPGRWRGLEHLYGLHDVSHVCLPDLVDVFATEPSPPAAAIDILSSPEIFVECSADEPPLPEDTPLSRLSAPRLDADGVVAWHHAVSNVRAFLDAWRRDALLIAALPLPAADAVNINGGTLHAQANWLGFLERSGVLGKDDTDDRRPRNALSQLVWPWLRTRQSSDLPQGLETAEGTLLGVLAANAITRGTFRSVAGTRLPDVIDCVPSMELGQGEHSPSVRLAQRVCLIGPEPEGIMLLSDVTPAQRPGWRFGGASRLMAAVLRAAARIGESAVFEPNGPPLWARLRRDMEGLLEAFRIAGGLGGTTADEAYSVRCDRAVMSQNDLDNGRVRIEVAVLPVAAVERITISLELRSASASGAMSEVA